MLRILRPILCDTDQKSPVSASDCIPIPIPLSATRGNSVRCYCPDCQTIEEIRIRPKFGAIWTHCGISYHYHV